MNAKITVRAVVIAMMALSVVACQKSDDNKDNDTNPAAVSTKRTAEETKEVRASAENALSSVGYEFNTYYIYSVGAPKTYAPKATWDKAKYRDFLKKIKENGGERPTRQMQIDALNTYIAGMETYIADNGGVPAETPAPTPEAAVEDMKDAKADKEEVADDVKAEDKGEAQKEDSQKGDDSQKGEEPQVEVVIQGELAMLQARVNLAKARLEKMQSRLSKEQKSEDKGADQSKDEPKSDEGKDQPAPAPEAPVEAPKQEEPKA